MGIDGIGRGAEFPTSSVPLDAETAVAMIALKMGIDGKDAQTQRRDAAYAAADRRADERIRLMSEKAVYTLTTGIASGALQCASGGLQIDVAAHPGDVDAKTALTVVDKMHCALKSSTAAGGELYDTDIARAEKAGKQFDRTASEAADNVRAAQQLIDRAIQSAGTVVESSDQTLLIAARMG